MHSQVESGTRATLWAATSDQRPLLVETELPGGLSMAHGFSFNQPLSRELFEVPAGYRQVTQGD